MKTKINIADIPDGNYEGYVWLSGSRNPKILRKDTFDFKNYGNETNPFVIEALLYDEDRNTSILIRHTGKYHIGEYDLNALPDGAELKKVKYLSHRLGDISKVCFKQLWIPEKDKNCQGWPVLTMKALIFTGFEK